MRKLIQTPLLIALFISTCIAGRCETTNALHFYIVSEQKIDGGKFIDTPEYPKLGYISATANLVVTNLLDVYKAKQAAEAILDGKVVPIKPSPTLTISLRPTEAKQFALLTEKAIEKRLLATIGDQPLSAPKVRMVIEHGSFSISFATESELKKVESELKKLVMR